MENIKPRSCCIDRTIARWMQEDRGWIFSHTARTVEVIKSFYYIALYVCQKQEQHSPAHGQNTKPVTLSNINSFNCFQMYKFISSLQSWLVKLLYSTISRILTKFLIIFKKNIVILAILSRQCCRETVGSKSCFSLFPGNKNCPWAIQENPALSAHS